MASLELSRLTDVIRASYASSLHRFSEFHDICQKGQFLSYEIMWKVEECAVDIRQLSIDSISVANKVSKEWIDSTVVFFEGIDDVDDPKAVLELLGKQAREIGECYRKIAGWARDLAGRLHETQDKTIMEAEENHRDAMKNLSAREKKDAMVRNICGYHLVVVWLQEFY